MTRQQINREILSLLIKFNEEHSDQRFGQMLVNCGLTSHTKDAEGFKVNQIEYYMESADFLYYMKRALDELNK